LSSCTLSFLSWLSIANPVHRLFQSAQDIFTVQKSSVMCCFETLFLAFLLHHPDRWIYCCWA
jgi:hypothetical protein